MYTLSLLSLYPFFLLFLPSPPISLSMSPLLSLLSYTCSSYIHAEWATFDKLLRGDKRFDGKVKHYKQKQAQLGIFANVSSYSTCMYMYVYMHMYIVRDL